MRRLSGVLLACAMLLIPAFSHGHGDLFAQSAPQKTTFTGDVVGDGVRGQPGQDRRL